MDAMLTLNDIDAAEWAVKNVRVKLQAIGREIYKIREGEELRPEYGFESYSRQQYENENYVGQEGPHWGAGTPILSLLYWWPRADDHIVVTFPQGWLEQDWRALEQGRLTAERQAIAEQEMLANEEAERAQEESNRQTFERLKAKYEVSHDQRGGSGE